MCVPAHDDRDFEFATKFNIPIIQVIAKDGEEIENMTEAYTDAVGTMINSGEWNLSLIHIQMCIRDRIDAFSKLKFESQFQALSSGGAISYVEVPDMKDNIARCV